MATSVADGWHSYLLLSLTHFKVASAKIFRHLIVCCAYNLRCSDCLCEANALISNRPINYPLEKDAGKQDDTCLGGRAKFMCPKRQYFEQVGIVEGEHLRDLSNRFGI